MSTFTKYLTEAAKSYDYKIKVAGQISDDFATRMETCLQKFEVAKMSAGKKTPIQSLPLDFPALSNESVTIFDVTTKPILIFSDFLQTKNFDVFFIFRNFSFLICSCIPY